MMNARRIRPARTGSGLGVALCLAGLWASPAHAQLVLNGITFNADTNSQGIGAETTFNTTGTSVNGTYLAFLASGNLSRSPSFINTGGDSNLNLSLSPGVYNYTLYMDAGTNSGYGSIDLFFNSGSNPQISTVSQQTGNLSSPTGFAADGRSGQLILNTQSFTNGSGALSYNNGSETVTLTNYQLTTAALDIASGRCVQSGAVGGGSCSGQLQNNIAAEITLDVTNDRTLASASNATPSPVNFGIVHVGSSASQALSISNTASPSGTTERLDGSIASNSTGITAGGSFSLLGAQSSSNALQVGLDTGTAGVKSGTATISLNSDGAGTSGYGTTSLGSQTVSVSGTVNNYAVAALAKVSGPATLTGSGNAYTLNLGRLAAGSGIHSEILAALNGAVGPADVLSGDFTESGSGFGLTGFSAFSDLGAQQASGDLDISIGTAVDGNFLETVDLHSIGSNSSGYSGALSDVILTVEASVVPEPMSAALLGIGLIGLVGARRRRA